MVRLKDIAEKTGLTVSAVSKALNCSPEIGKASADLVRETARLMGYAPRKGKPRSKKTIGVILPEVRSHYYAELMHSLSREIEQRGYSMISMLTTQYSASVTPYVKKLCQHHLDGMLVSCDNAFSDEAYQILLDSRIPTLLLTEVDLPYLMDSIYIKAETGVRLALDHLIQLGHTRIGYLGEYNSDTRFHAFCNILEQNHIPVIPGFMKRGKERFEEGGYLRAMELLEERELPTAILASYDQIAYGAMRAFRERNISIPEDISIVGFDNIVMDSYYPIPLTSVTNPVEQMGITAVKILLDAIHHPNSHVVQNVALQSRLVVRSSTCPPGMAAPEPKG